MIKPPGVTLHISVALPAVVSIPAHIQQTAHTHPILLYFNENEICFFYDCKIVYRISSVTAGGFIVHFCTIICILIVLLL
jgi:hypothetical protein